MPPEEFNQRTRSARAHQLWYLSGVKVMSCNKWTSEGRLAFALACMTALGWLIATASQVDAQTRDITLRMKGGGFQIRGALKAYDGKAYHITSVSFGNMSLDATRFDCVEGDCPTEPITAPKVASFAATGAPTKFSIAGSNTVGNALMPALIEAYAKSAGLETVRVDQADPLDVVMKLRDRAGREVASIDLRRHGSSTSFRELQAKTALIGMSSRRIKDGEVTKLRTAGLGNMRSAGSEHVLSLDGLQIVVATDNPAVSISLDNAAKIFAGEITDWSALGLPPGPIKVHAPTPDSGTWDTFNSLVLKPRKAKLAATATRTEDHAELSDRVAADPLAIGFGGIAYQRSAKPLNIETSCGLIVPPSRFAMKTEEYPLTRRLYLYSVGRPKNRLAGALLDYSLSDAAQPIVDRMDFIDQSTEVLSFSRQGSRIAYALNAPNENFDFNLMKKLISDLRGKNRLSLTFRFNASGTSQLDARATSDVRRLANLLARPKNKGKEVILVGFADTVGPFAGNLSLSTNRANVVRNAMLAAVDAKKIGGNRIKVAAYGELAPVACNNTEAGRRFNRRVEVWMDGKVE